MKFAPHIHTKIRCELLNQPKVLDCLFAAVGYLVWGNHGKTELTSVPINFFTRAKGTPLDSRESLVPLEALKIIAIYRLILSDCGIRICGGRPATLRDLNSHIFLAGANGLLIGNYLTTLGRNPVDDLQMIKDMGFEI